MVQGGVTHLGLSRLLRQTGAECLGSILLLSPYQWGILLKNWLVYVGTLMLTRTLHFHCDLSLQYEALANKQTFSFLFQVEAFVIDQDDLADEAEMEEKYYLPSEEDSEDTVDPETQARLEALLEAAGIYSYSSK